MFSDMKIHLDHQYDNCVRFHAKTLELQGFQTSFDAYIAFLNLYFYVCLYENNFDVFILICILCIVSRLSLTSQSPVPSTAVKGEYFSTL